MGQKFTKLSEIKKRFFFYSFILKVCDSFVNFVSFTINDKRITPKKYEIFNEMKKQRAKNLQNDQKLRKV